MDKKTNNSNDLEFVNNEKEQDFYRDLDNKTSHRSCCTWQTLILFFVGILLILSGALFFIYWQVSRGGVNFNLMDKPPLGNIENKILESNPDIQGQFNLAITSDELNSILNNGLSIQDFILKDATASINPNNVLIYGNLVKPLNSKIVLEVVPKAENNKLSFKVFRITAGNIVLPAMFNRKVETSLNELADRKMVKFYEKANVTEATLGQNEINVKGISK